MSSPAVKKVKPYPIEGQLSAEGVPPAVINIIRLVPKGFIADVNAHFYKVGDLMRIRFALPVTGQVITSVVRVIKTYDRNNIPAKRIDRFAEFHFQGLSDADLQHIDKFVRRIGQKDEKSID